MDNCYCDSNRTRDKIAKDMLEAESDMLQCLSCLFCENLSQDIARIKDPVKKAVVANKIICAYAEKEKAMAKLVDVLRKFGKLDEDNCYY